MNARLLWVPLLVVILVGAVGVTWMGVQTYRGAPPIAAFQAPSGEVIATPDDVLLGQQVFQKYALMQYGTMFGDGGARGPDFTASALHEVTVAMRAHYLAEAGATGRTDDTAIADVVAARVKRELKENGHRQGDGTITLSAGEVKGFERVAAWVREMFLGDGPEAFRPKQYLTDATELRQLAAFFFWGAWVCSAERPGSTVSYTHNWPYDPEAGNVPGTSVLLWSVLGGATLIFGLGVVLWLYGRMGRSASWQAAGHEAVATQELVDRDQPTPTQRATYKFFAVAALLFLFQVLAGVLTIHDFVGLTSLLGLDVQALAPLPVTRSWHVQVAVLWIAACWIGASIHVLPRITGIEPAGQKLLVNVLFWMLVVTAAGTVGGGYLGPMGLLGENWRLLGNQGWEFVELGRAFQGLLFASLVLWVVIVLRGVRQSLSGKDGWFTLPHWLLYTTLAICVLFLSSFVAGPRTNFVIADFWRWMVIHMWAECFFEVFTTVIVAWFLVAMGLVTKKAARFTVYFAVLLFWGTGFLGISHNFYWNAKPAGTLAVGSVFSTMQVIPLILLTVEAWRFKRLPQQAMENGGGGAGGARRLAGFGLAEAFLFMVAVNFWNFLGAGVFGFLINLPIVNYYEHGTYLTVNHGHAALMGVYGNLSIAGMLFCARYLIRPERWNAALLRTSFWSLNIGLMLTVVLDLFPAGIAQLIRVLDDGLWAARSQDFVQGATFQTLTWLRLIGGALFVLGGVLPLVWFLVSRWTSLRESAPLAMRTPFGEPAAEREDIDAEVVPGTVVHP